MQFKQRERYIKQLAIDKGEKKKLNELKVFPYNKS